MKLNDILKNREIASIVAALGAGVGSDCNLDLMRYGRVVVLVDADVDGSHIATLLATLFWRTMRPIIETGKFFIARPPLYLIRNKKKSASSYIYSEEERRQYIRKWKSDNISLQRYKGLGEMNPEQLRETVFVLPESLPDKKRGKKKLKNQDVTLTADHFSQRDIRMTIDDVHRTRSLIERLMGSNVAPRKEWLMNTDWSAEEDLS